MEAKSPVVGNKLPIFNPLASLVVVVAVAAGEGLLLAVGAGGVGFSQAAKRKPLAMVAILKARERRILDIVNYTSQTFRELMIYIKPLNSK
jgi:malonyl CoA-acyl carrier protein transacylase